MSQEKKKTLTFLVSNETFKKIKILSIQKEISLPDLCKDIMEKYTSGKKGVSLEVQQEDQ